MSTSEPASSGSAQPSAKVTSAVAPSISITRSPALSPLLTSKSLKEVYFHPKKKHYSHSLKELNAAFGQ